MVVFFLKLNQHSTAQHSTAQHSTAQHSTAQHSTNDNLNFDLVLLVSNEKERISISNALLHLFPTKFDSIRFLDIELYIRESFQRSDLLDNYKNNINRCIVNLKKHVGMYWASSYYENICVIDCDTIFKNLESTQSLFSRLKENYEKKKYFGAISTDNTLISIIKGSAFPFFDKDREKIMEFTKNFTIYPWFFDVPFYTSSDLRDFYSFVQKYKSDGVDFWTGQDWYSFEHLTFIWFRCLYKNCELVDYTEIANGIPEHLSLTNIMRINYRYNYLPVWARLSHITKHEVNIIGTENINLLYHTDRM